MGVCLGKTVVDILEKMLVKSEYFADMVTGTLLAIRAAIWTLRFRFTFISSTKKVETYTTKAFGSASNNAFANSSRSMIWTSLVVGKVFAIV